MERQWKRLTRAAGDNGFGPKSPVFSDLTLNFEDIAFTTGPSALLLCIIPYYIWRYMRSPVTTAKEPLIFLKLGANSILIALHVVSAVLYNSPDDSTSISLSSSVTSCLAALGMAIFMHLEHRHAVESSPVPGVYLLATLLLDAGRARSYFLRSDIGLYTLGCLTVAIAVTKFALLALGEFPKRYRSKGETPGPESTTGFWGRTFFVWVNSTLILGFRNILSVADLPNLEVEFASAKLAAIFEPIWKKESAKAPSQYALVKAVFWAELWPFLAVLPARLLHMGFKFAEPLLLQRTLHEIPKPDRDPEVIQALIGAMALVHFGLTITRAWYKNLNNRVVAQTRGILISQIIRKSFYLGPREAKRSAASTLMSTDVDGIVEVIPSVHETWASVVELCVSVYLLSTVVFYAAFITMLPAVATAAASIEIGRRLVPLTQSWNLVIEDRVSMTSKVLSQLRGIKMIAVEKAIGDYIQSLRHLEIGHSKNARKLNSWRIVTLTMSYATTPIAVVAAALFWSGFDAGLDAVSAFTALAFVHLAAQPMAAIILSWSKIGGMFACFKRIQAYLLLPERVDSRAPLNEKSPTRDLERFPIQFENASVASPDGSILFTADLAFEASTTNMIIGPTGVGKSIMLRSVLGEAEITSGSLCVKPQQIAYCDQEEWVCNATIRENIIGCLPYDEVWYNKVITACMLHDLNEFPLGHLTLVGTRGANLSGGQRQRLELARAVYLRSKVVLLDGVLSALDRQSAAAILKQLVGEGGLLRTLGTTVIMTTHSVELLKSADRVVVIHANGTVSIQSPEDAIKEYEGKGFLDDFSDDGEEISDDGSQASCPTRHYTPPEPQRPIPTHLAPTGDLALYKYYLKSVSKSIFAVWLVVLVLLVVTEKGPDIYMRLWTENAPKNKMLFVGYAAFGVVTVFINLAWSRIFLLHLVPQSAERLHRVLIDAVTNSTLSFLTYTDSGALLNRFSQDMSLIIKDLPITFFHFTYSLFGLLVTFGIICAAVEYAAIMIPFFLTILFGVQLFYLRTSKQLRLLDIEAKSPIYTFLTETSEGIYHIRAFQWEQDYLSRGLELLDKSQKPFYYRFCIQRWLGVVLDLIVTAIGVVLTALALYIGSATQAAIGLGLLKVIQLSASMVEFMEDWVDLETSLGALSRTRAFEKDTPQEIETNESGDSPALPENWPHRGEIVIENVNADHVINGKDYRALHNLSVEIAPGSKVGIVGRTGSGKTTFLLTLLNFLKFTGSITIDGIDITTISRRHLRSRIITISQESIELPGSVRDNLAPEEMMMAKDDRRDNALLIDVLEKVGLYQKITRAGGLDKPIKDIGLSAGQQQLLALARALVHHRQTNSKVVFVDEATNYIDYESEEKLQEVMDKTFGDCTVLTISHRNYSLQSATNFLELSSGKLLSYE